MKLNPLKCAFRVISGKFLGLMVTQREIEANPVQLQAIRDSQAPTTRRGVQQLTGRLTTLGQLISSSTDWLRPFFNIIKGAKRTRWNEECN